MAVKPYFTSSDLIEAVKRKISFPASNVTFTHDDILRFANEEMFIAQVPSVLQWHEEYFVTSKVVPLEDSRNRYPIPDRAIGMKLRDLFYQDTNGNLYEMTRIKREDQAYFQGNNGAGESIHKYFLEGNDVVLSPQINGAVTGSLLFVYFLRPNQLVENNRAAIITNFVETITVNNASIVANDTITIDDQVFTAVAGAPAAFEFQIGVTSIVTATNLVAAITATSIVSGASNGTPSTNTVTLTFSDRNLQVTTSNPTAFVIPITLGIQFDQIPMNIAVNTEIDVLQTKPGHKTYTMDITVVTGAISGNVINFTDTLIPEDVLVGDYIASANECIIPQIPPDLHNALAERTCARILSALGDQAGLTMTNTKIAEIEQRQGTLLDNRVEGSPMKVANRHSLLRFGKLGFRRRY